MTDSFHFEETERSEIPVTYGTRTFILQEPTEDVVRQFTDAQTACGRFSGGEVKKFEGTGGLQSFLVSLCLFEVGESEGKRALKRVTQAALLQWRSFIVKRLFEKAKEMGGIGEPGTKAELLEQRDEIDKQLEKLEEGPAKNEPSDTQDSSE